MLASSVSSALVGSVPIFHGPWMSHGLMLPAGPMLTMSTFWFKFISAGITLLTAFVVARLWRFLCAAVFYFTFRDTKITVVESRNNVILVNAHSALGALSAMVGVTDYQRRMPTFTQTSIFSAALLAIAMKSAIPAVIAQISSYDQALAASDVCTVNLGSSSLFVELTVKGIQLANAALFAIDANETVNNIQMKVNTLATPLPIARQSYTSTCPPLPSACDAQYPFTFSSNYTLLSHHFAINTRIPFSLQVADTCYRARLATAPLLKSNGTPVPYGLHYGPVNVSIAIPDSVTPYTELYYPERKYSPGYTLSSHWALANNPSSVWLPNSTLIQGGDTTALFYYVGGVSMFQPSSDPIFATSPEPWTTTVAGSLYSSVNVVSPIMCDTQYVFCAEGRCSPPGGQSSLVVWLNSQTGGPEWADFQKVFQVLLAETPMYVASLGSNAVLAAHTAEFFQFDATNATTPRELGRLSQAGMIMLAATPQLLVGGYWDLADTPSPPSSTLCKNIVVQTANSVTIPLVPYITLLVISLIIVAVSYVKQIPCMRKSKLWRHYAYSWALHYSGQLHREVIERLNGELEGVNTTTVWPAFNPPSHPGPDVITYGDSGFKRFSAAQLAEDVLSPVDILVDHPPEIAPLLTTSKPQVVSIQSRSFEGYRINESRH